MGASWRAEEFRGMRVALVMASALGWALWIAEPLRPNADATFVVERIAVGVSGALLTHLGLFISLRLERGSRVLRVFAAVVMLPNVLFAGVSMAFVINEVWRQGGMEEYVAATSSLLLLHAMQMWRLGGFAFPRLQPVVGGSSSSNFDTYAAPGAERNAGR